MPKKTTKEEEAVVEEKKSTKRKVSEAEKIDKDIAKLESKKEAIHLKAEEEKFNAIVCGVCETPLNVLPETHMKPGVLSVEYICPNCERVNIIQSEYDGPVEVVEGVIKQRTLGFVWLEKPVFQLNDEQVIELAKQRAEEVKEAESRLPPREQELFRIIGILLNKVK